MTPKYWILMALPLVVLGLTMGLAVGISKGKSERCKAVADRLGMRKADEMERQIQYKSVAIAYNVVLFALLGITYYSVFIKQESMPLSNLALLLGVLTQAVATLVLRHRSTEGDEEYPSYPLWKTFLWIFGIAALIICLGGALVIVVLAS